MTPEPKEVANILPPELLKRWGNYVTEVEAYNEKCWQQVREWNIEEDARRKKRQAAYDEAQKCYQEKYDLIMAKIDAYNRLPWYKKMLKDRPLYPFERLDLIRPWYLGILPSMSFPTSLKKPTIEEFLTRLTQSEEKQ